ncbi:MAG TPA: HD domain-containing protein [Vicinamibacterales bacterium]|jgi:[protein-PII] uridylyltransferase|nr:HD domain-containing protein [Vicinamibacterales bacterium]
MSDHHSAEAEPLPDSRQLRTRRLEEARGELSAATAGGAGGRHALKQYSQRIDAIIQQLFAGAGAPSQLVGVFALGGYGRRQLCLHSDIDLLVLFAEEIRSADERFLQNFLNPLWDLGLSIGHHVREVSEGSRLADDNAEFLLALTDARPVAGDATLLDAFLAQTERAKMASRTLDALRTLIAERHARFNDTLYQLEPDVKDAPGGLRDLFGAATIARITDPRLLTQGGATPRALEDAEEFLFRVRSVLHLESKRHHNVLSHELQERVAETLAYPGQTPRERVERLMGDYFRHARAVYRTVSWALKSAPQPIGDNLVLSAENVRFVDAREAADRPETWLSLFRSAIDYRCPVADEALLTVEQNAGRYGPRDFFPTPASRRALLDFLKPRRGLYARLTEMHDAGLLGQMFPEFKRISFLVVRDFYHKYTVDEHTLLTIRNLERLIDASGPRERFSRLLSEVDEPELLVLSLLYHDCGKGSGKPHEEESRRLAAKMLDRLELSPEARSTVEFLVSEHLKMSLVAFRRDTEDPEIVRQFATLVGVEDRLKSLCLMTLADVEAVSLETLTPWKEELLWRLYVDAYNHLTLSYGDEVIDSKQAAIADLADHRPDDLSHEQITEFLKGLPRRYLQLFPRDAVYRHVRLARDLAPGSIQVWLERTESAWELTVLTRDQPFLFSNISGVLSSFGMDILRGFAFTKPDGLVVDMFHFNDDERFLELNESGNSQLLKSLEDVIAGRKDIAVRLRGREEGALRRRLPGFAPVVHCDNESSKRYTIVEIVAENALGLLYRMSRAMSESGCDVDLVLMATEGRRAIDVFHLTRGGAKLTSEQQLGLTDNLLRVLEGRP